MKLQLIEGEFNSNEALELITQMIHIKIKFHENKISNCEIEEDIKARETKIKRLQKNLSEVRQSIGSHLKSLKINAILELQ